MIKAATIQTIIIDDIHLACHELKEQLNAKLTLLKNSIGIIQADPEFIEAGIMEPLYNTLGIPLVGGTTISIATNDEIGDFMFSLLVLTSDDVEFCPSRTYGLYDNYANAIENSMKKTITDSILPLRMVLIFPTVTDNLDFPGDCYVEAVEKICGAIPVFGTLSVDDSIHNFEHSKSVFNGEIFDRDMSYVLMFGEINPRFHVATAPVQTALTNFTDIITRSSGHVIHEINNMTAAEYFEQAGLASNGAFVDGIYFVPLYLAIQIENEIQHLVRAIVEFTEDGSAMCRGKIPEGAKIAFGSILSSDIIAALTETVTQITQEENVNAALIFSCLIRRLSIGSDSMRELAHIKDTFEGVFPFMASYSGGEISPIGKNNHFQNAFHNYSLIVCLL